MRKEPAERVLAGDSLGGSVSVHLALRYPHLFTRIISLSGAFYEKSQAMIREEKDLSWLDIYMIVGLQEDNYATDTGVYNFVELNRSTKALLEERGATISYFEKDGRHLWGFWQKSSLPLLCTSWINRLIGKIRWLI